MSISLADTGTRQHGGTSNIAARIEALEGSVAAMSVSLESDFVDGTIGTRHNTYEHRARVLRRVTAELEQLRASQSGSSLPSTLDQPQASPTTTSETLS